MTMKPMLAYTHEDGPWEGDQLMSPKIDGFRNFNDGGHPLTRSRKPQPNNHVNKTLSGMIFHGLDGELVVGDITDPHVFQKSSGDLRRATGTPDWSWHIFDDFSRPDLPFTDRYEIAQEKVERCNVALGEKRLYIVAQELVSSIDEFNAYEAKVVGLGYEGAMKRRPDGLYKFGRSTAREGYLGKVKRFDHDEAVVLDYEELMHNENEEFTNELGRTARSSHQDGLVASGMVGSLVCANEFKWPGQTFKISCGSMTLDERKELFQNFSQYKRRLARFKHFSHGAKDKPRHGIWDGWRDQWDMDEVYG